MSAGWPRTVIPLHPGDLRHGGPSGLEVPQHLPGRLEKSRPGRGQPDPMSDPREELDPELGLEVLDRQREGGLGDEDRPGCRGESSMVDHRHEVCELSAVHLHSLSN